MKQIRFCGVHGKTCKFCKRPIKTYELIRIGAIGHEEYLHVGCFKFYHFKSHGVRKPKVKPMPAWVIKALGVVGIAYAALLFIARPSL